MAIIPQLAIAGLPGAKRVMLYKLDPTLTTPLVPVVLDLLPTQAISPFSAGLDVAESVSKTSSYTISQNPLLNFATTTSNAHKELETASVSGIISATPIGGLFAPTPPTFGIVRRDMLVATIIENMAAARQPVLVVTPDWVMPRAFIESITRTSDAGDGEVVRLSITFREARVISPTLAAGNISAAAMIAGAIITAAAGAVAGKLIETPAALAAGELG